ncbi:MAG: arylsulfatase A-like enzyme [Myxococcota bacterium]|jgi:arylsulfatase A-like enzyme
MQALLLALLGCDTATPVGRDAAHDSATASQFVAPRAVPAPSVLPHNPLPSTPLRCEGDGEIAWTVNGIPWPGLADDGRVPAGVTRAGDRWVCSRGGHASAPVVVTAPGGNVLIVLLDDIGVDKIALYGDHPNPSPTPHLDQLAAQGLVFDAAYAYPSCSPTRAALLTGRVPRRTGVGNGINLNKDTYTLPLAELSLAELAGLSERHRYSDAFIGKWHLASRAWPTVARNPLEQGFDRWVGSLTNLDLSLDRADRGTTYTYWEKVDNGELSWSSTYATIDTTDSALATMAALPEPWFLYVSYNASHTPLSPAPEHLHGFGPQHRETPDADRFDAVTEAVDRELGRLLASVDGTDTTVFVLSDNGTTAKVIRPPWDPTRGKLTLYEGGTRVPMIAWGQLVAEPGSRTEALVQVTDLFPTLGDIVGVRWQELAFADGRPRVIDGMSLLPYLADPSTPSLRQSVITSRFAPNGGGPYSAYDEIAVRDGAWKYMDTLDGEQLFRFSPQRFDEGEDLLAQGADALPPDALAALSRLRMQARAHVDDSPYDHR